MLGSNPHPIWYRNLLRATALTGVSMALLKAEEDSDMSRSFPTPTHRRGTRGPAPTAEVNLRDVAAHAGVSPATASRVFSGNAAVSEETRAKVLDAANELGYVVNALAQAMMGTGRRPLAFVTSGITDPAFAELASGAEHVAATHGYLFVMSLTGSDTDREQNLIETLCEQRAAGVLLTGPTEPGAETEQRIAHYSAELASVGATLILCAHPYLPALPKVLTVNYDRVGGVRRTVQHLISHHHSRIAFLGCGTSTTVSQLFLGYSLGLKDAGLALDSGLVIKCPDDIVEAHLATLLLLRGQDPPTAIICATDTIALGVYRAARDLQVTIPAQLSVTGFGDSPFATDLVPTLTTIHVPFFEVGVRAAELALGLARDSSRAELPTELIVRDSTD
jgi:LacI family transcriptional regulator